MRFIGAAVAVLILVTIACAPSAAPPPQPSVSTYEVVHTYPHDPSAYTEGLLFHDGFLYESTGLFEQSSIRKMRLETGEILQRRDLPGQYFGEGIAIWRDRLIQLTYQSQKGFVYDLASFEPRSEFSYPGEGWALTTDSTRIIMSDGTSNLRFLNPATLQETGRLQVTDEGRPVTYLNELEWVKGEILVNVWHSNRIARIDPVTGRVKGWIDCTGLYPLPANADREDVLNGIAYDVQHDRLYVTGKRWPKMFEIRVVVR